MPLLFEFVNTIMSSKHDMLINAPLPQARPHDDEDDPRPQDCAPLTYALPPGFVMTEWAVGTLRQYLLRIGLSHYQICHCTDLDLNDIEYHLSALDEAQAQWESLPAALSDGEPMEALTHGKSGSRIWPVGVLHLRKRQVVLARWYWVDEIEVFRQLWLIALAEPANYLSLRNALRRQRRHNGARKWEIVRNGWQSSQWLPRESISLGSPQLLLSAQIRQRVEAEIIGFFSPNVELLYKDLKVPYRRGVLLHGPPGNGKTSLIRFIGSALPELPMLVLRPCAHFDADTLGEIFKKWSAVAPSVLIIEDLDWLLKQVNISAFLNALDGIDSGSENGNEESNLATRSAAAAVGHGLLLIATTNHPDQLDPAVNNRPGRFDVVMEIGCPDQTLRREFFAHRLPLVDAGFLDQLSQATDGLSFAHLQEVLRASALQAIHEGRSDRTASDLLSAVERVRDANESAERGFPAKLDAPFGLSSRRPTR
jgi:hypothetical protein